MDSAVQTMFAGMNLEGLPTLPGMDVRCLEDSTEGIILDLSASSSPFFDREKLYFQIRYCHHFFPLSKLHIELMDNVELIQLHEEFHTMFQDLKEFSLKYLHYNPTHRAERLRCDYFIDMPQLKSLYWQEPQDRGHYRMPTDGIPALINIYAPKLQYANVQFRPMSAYWNQEFIRRFGGQYSASGSNGSLELTDCKHLKKIHTVLGDKSLFKVFLDGVDSIEELVLADVAKTTANWTLILEEMKSLRSLDVLRCDPAVIEKINEWATRRGISALADENQV